MVRLVRSSSYRSRRTRVQNGQFRKLHTTLLFTSRTIIALQSISGWDRRDSNRSGVLMIVCTHKFGGTRPVVHHRTLIGNAAHTGRILIVHCEKKALAEIRRLVVFVVVFECDLRKPKSGCKSLSLFAAIGKKSASESFDWNCIETLIGLFSFFIQRNALQKNAHDVISISVVITKSALEKRSKWLMDLFILYSLASMFTRGEVMSSSTSRNR